MDRKQLKAELETYRLMAQALREITPGRLARMDFNCQQAHHAAVQRVNLRLYELTKITENGGSK